MTEKPGVATRLMYGLFIALNNKTKSNLTGTAMETMRAAAPVKLEGVESVMYKEVTIPDWWNNKNPLVKKHYN